MYGTPSGRIVFSAASQVRKNCLNIKFLGRIFLGHPGPRRRDIPDKNFMQVAFFCCFRHGVAGMFRDLGWDVPDLEKLYARKLQADFSYPNKVLWEGSQTLRLRKRGLPSGAFLGGRFGYFYFSDRGEGKGPSEAPGREGVVFSH